MSEWAYRGDISASKSILNRALILQSYNPQMTIVGDSRCDDVQLMKKALREFSVKNSVLECGHAGTVFRFLALRVSRRPGEYVLKASSRLLSRPQAGLYQIFDQLGVKYQIYPEEVHISSVGWKGSELIVDGSESSQFVSSIFLNAWELSEPLTVRLQERLVSRGYLDMTLAMVEQMGLSFKKLTSQSWQIAAHQNVRPQKWTAEPDLSSCLAVAALAAMKGQCEILNFPNDSLQPDRVFCDFFSEMQIPRSYTNNTLSVQRKAPWQPLVANINNCPDVVPVLSVLLAQASGVSQLTGFEHLVHKESNRLHKVQELLALLDRRSGVENSVFWIEGRPEPFHVVADFNPDQDHRMAMAAQVACFGGATLNILDRNVVDKSFPEFWQIAGRE